MTVSNKVVKEHKLYRKLQDQSDEYLGYVQYYSSQCDEKDKELRFLYDFLRYKGISEEYENFRENAHEVDNPDIFPFYIL